jgi:hypothetical protein
MLTIVVVLFLCAKLEEEAMSAGCRRMKAAVTTARN